MRITETDLPGVLCLEPRVFGDERGFFLETFRADQWPDAAPPAFVQDNQSRSRHGVLRGLHYQWQRPQGKLVRVARGRVFDVAVDVRRDSARFGHWFGCVLDDVDHRQLYIPPGFAHGFLVLSEVADFVYRCTDTYHPESETGLRYDDPAIGIEWPDIDGPVQVSDKDAALPGLASQTDWPVSP